MLRLRSAPLAARLAGPLRVARTPQHGTRCLNCGRAPLDSAFCPDCGQENVNRAVAIGHLAREAWSEFWQWDGKFFRTVLSLLFRPGSLTNAYNSGRRVAYVSPFKMYLVTSALFFVLIAGRTPKHVAPPLDPARRTAAIKEVTREAGASPPLRRLLEQRIRKHAENPAGFVQGLFATAPKAMFFLLPAYALLLKILYVRSRRLYVEHLVYALHNHTFFFGALAAAMLLDRSVVTGLLLSATVVYEFIALRAVYRQGTVKTLFKQFLLFSAYGAILIIGIVGTIVATLLLS